MRYLYSIIRFVPDPARGEFINVGVIAGGDKAYEWTVRIVDNPSRAMRLDDRGASPSIWSFVSEVQGQIDEWESSLEAGSTTSRTMNSVSEQWLDKMASRMRHVIQLSRPAPIVADSLSEAVEFVYNTFIVDLKTDRNPLASKLPAMSAVKSAYASERIRPGKHLAEHSTVESQSFDTRLDFAVLNGRAVQLTQTWSMQRRDQRELLEDIKAWAWTIRQLREHGGNLRIPSGHSVSIRPDVDIEVVYIPQEPGKETKTFDEAMHTFSVVRANTVPMNEARQVSHRAKQLLIAANVMLDI